MAVFKLGSGYLASSLNFGLVIRLPRSALQIVWVRGRAIGKGIDFPDIGMRNGIDLL